MAHNRTTGEIEFSFENGEKVMIVNSDLTQAELGIESLKNIDLVRDVKDGDESRFGKYDYVLSGLRTPRIVHSVDDFNYYAKYLKPGGKVALFEGAKNEERVRKMETDLIISGFIDIQSSLVESLKMKFEGNYCFFRGYSDSNAVSVTQATRVNYELGSSKPVNGEKTDLSSVWKLDGNDDDIIDSNDLLEAEDLAKPSPDALRVCGTATNKPVRKACKDCTCGLAEELKKGEVAAESKPSSCGSCYLGDAFRCSSCPYLGMPAFKPGEKVELKNDQLVDEL